MVVNRTVFSCVSKYVICQMLRHRTLIEVLGQVNTAGITGAFLFNGDGILLAYNGYETNASVLSALVSNVWESFNRKGGREDLREMIIMCEDGSLAVTKLANIILALKAKPDVQPGFLRAKLRSLADFLREPMTLVSKTLVESTSQS